MNKSDVCKEYDVILSIGEACFCAMLLAESDLRPFSCPFDWVYGGSFSDRIQVLLDKFENFLPEDNLVATDANNTSERYDVYWNKRNSLMFNHDFASGVPYTQSFVEVSKKYSVRINRLLHFLSRDVRILLVYMELPDNKINSGTLPEVIASVAKLNELYPASISLQYWEHIEGCLTNLYSVVSVTPNIEKIILFNRDVSITHMHRGNSALAKKIFHSVRLTDKFKVG